MQYLIIKGKHVAELVMLNSSVTRLLNTIKMHREIPIKPTSEILVCGIFQHFILVAPYNRKFGIVFQRLVDQSRGMRDQLGQMKMKLDREFFYPPVLFKMKYEANNLKINADITYDERSIENLVIENLWNQSMKNR